MFCLAVCSSGSLASGWTWWSTTVCQSKTMSWCLSTLQKDENSGVLFWRRPMPSKSSQSVDVCCLQSHLLKHVKHAACFNTSDAEQSHVSMSGCICGHSASVFCSQSQWLLRSSVWWLHHRRFRRLHRRNRWELRPAAASLQPVPDCEEGPGGWSSTGLLYRCESFKVVKEDFRQTGPSGTPVMCVTLKLWSFSPLHKMNEGVNMKSQTHETLKLLAVHANIELKWF